MAEDLKVEAQKLIDDKLRDRKIRAIADLLEEKEHFTLMLKKVDEKIAAIEGGTFNPSYDGGECRKNY